MLNFYKKILLQLGKSQEDFKYIADRPGYDLRYEIDASKLHTELGFKTLYVDFDKGVKKLSIGIKNMKIGSKR